MCVVAVGVTDVAVAVMTTVEVLAVAVVVEL